MKLFWIVLTLAASFIATCATAEQPSPVGQNLAKWQLTFQDEFNSVGLDRNKWNTNYAWGRTAPWNGELEYYTDDENFTFSDGRLHIVPKKKNMGGMAYTSGMITTRDKFAQHYGYFEMKARLPKGKGFWPGFWLLVQDKKVKDEIDIMEFLGHVPNEYHMGTHMPDPFNPSGDIHFGSHFDGPDLTTGPHVYGVDWEEEYLDYYLDGNLTFHLTNPTFVPHNTMYILVNLAVGGSWPGAPDANTSFNNNDMEVYYIRVWQRAGR